MSDKLYTEDIKIECRPYNGFRNKWKAESAYIRTPYDRSFSIGENVTCYARTAEEAVERLKDKLCKVTAEQERKHAEHLEWKAGIKDTTFSREQDCNPVVPRPKVFAKHP
jgi:hypothetical protein